MKHHPVMPVHESKVGSVLQQRARERNFDLMCLTGISINLRRILYRSRIRPEDEDPEQLEAKVKDLCNYIEARVKRSYDRFKKEYKEAERANKSSK